MPGIELVRGKATRDARRPLFDEQREAPSCLSSLASTQQYEDHALIMASQTSAAINAGQALPTAQANNDDVAILATPMPNLLDLLEHAPEDTRVQVIHSYVSELKKYVAAHPGEVSRDCARPGWG